MESVFGVNVIQLSNDFNKKFNCSLK